MLEGRGLSFAVIFKFIMELSQTQHITLFIDEFQDFYRVNPSIFSEMQNIWDSYKNKTRINLLVASSVNTLMNKIFKDKQQPLFGRQTGTIHVRPFRPVVLNYSIYFSILTLIAQGRNTRSELENALNIKEFK